MAVIAFLACAISSATEPGAIVEQSMDAAKRGDWARGSALMHPDALAAAKALFRPIVDSDATGSVAQLFFGVADLESYDALSNEATYTALWSNLSSKIPAFGEAARSSQVLVIGAVRESSDLVHVVYRGLASSGGINISKVSVATLKLDEGQWRLMLSGRIDGLAARLKDFARIATQSPSTPVTTD